MSSFILLFSGFVLGVVVDAYLHLKRDKCREYMYAEWQHVLEMEIRLQQDSDWIDAVEEAINQE